MHHLFSDLLPARFRGKQGWCTAHFKFRRRLSLTRNQSTRRLEAGRARRLARPPPAKERLQCVIQIGDDDLHDVAAGCLCTQVRGREPLHLRNLLTCADGYAAPLPRMPLPHLASTALRTLPGVCYDPVVVNDIGYPYCITDDTVHGRAATLRSTQRADLRKRSNLPKAPRHNRRWKTRFLIPDKGTCSDVSHLWCLCVGGAASYGACERHPAADA